MEDEKNTTNLPRLLILADTKMRTMYHKSKGSHAVATYYSRRPQTKFQKLLTECKNEYGYAKVIKALRKTESQTEICSKKLRVML